MLAVGLLGHCSRSHTVGRTPAVAWAKRFGDEGENAQALGVAVDRAGNVLVAGWFLGTADFGGGPVTSEEGDAFVARYSSNGSLIWSKAFGGSKDDSATAVAVDASANVYLAGDFRAEAGFGGQRLRSEGDSDLFVAKFAPDGSHLWSKRFGGPSYEHGARISLDSGGNLLLAATFSATIDVGGISLSSAGQSDILLTKLTADGDVVWAKRYGGAGFDLLDAVARGPRDEIVIAGEFDGSTVLGGQPLTASASRDVFVARYTSEAEHVWSKRFGNLGLNHAQGAAVDSTSAVWLTGSFSEAIDFGGRKLRGVGSSDAFIVKLSGGGEPVWAGRFGGSSSRQLRTMPGAYPTHSSGNALVVAPAGEVICVGAFAGSGKLAGTFIDAEGPSAEEAFEDLVLAAYSSSGESRWVLHLGNGNHTAVAAARDPTGAVLVTGHFSGALGDKFLPPSRGGGFVAKLTPPRQ